MRMRKWIAVAAALLLAVLAGTGAAEDGITLRTISCFAGQDGSADEYVAILQRYESMTGNTVIDNSSTTDEAWKTSILKDFAAGNEPDVLFFFAAGADSAPILSRVVSLEEINASYPDMNLPENDILREPDGKVYAVPGSFRSPSPFPIFPIIWRRCPCWRAPRGRSSKPGRKPLRKFRHPGWRQWL